MKYSTKTYNLLKTMYKKGSINRKLFARSELKRLFQDHYIINSTNYYDENVYLTEEGRAYVEEVKSNKKRTVHDWINTGIAIGSFIVAIISIIVSLMQQ